MRHTAFPDNLLLGHSAPLYQRASNAIRELIAANGLQPGDQLPAESLLATELGISRPTLREALMELRNQGLIDRRHGVGTFVTEPREPALQGGLEELKSLRDLSSRTDVEVVRSEWWIEQVDASEVVSQVLQLEPGAPVIRVRSAASIEGIWCATLESFLSEKYVDSAELEDYQAGSLLDYLMEREPPPVAYTKSDIRAMAVEGPAARWIRVDDGTSVLHLQETFFTAAGHPVLFSLNNFRTEIISFHIVRKVL